VRLPGRLAQPLRLLDAPGPGMFGKPVKVGPAIHGV
jgi:hypothetical protein